MKNLEITKENCEGYIKLFESRYGSMEDSQIGKKAGFYALLGSFLIIIPAIFKVDYSTFNVLFSIFGALEGVNIINYFYEIIKLNLNRKKDLEINYPYVDNKVSNDELKKALMDVNVLSKKYGNGTYSWNLNIDDYKKIPTNDLIIEQINDNVIEEKLNNNADIIDIDFIENNNKENEVSRLVLERKRK